MKKRTFQFYIPLYRGKIWVNRINRTNKTNGAMVAALLHSPRRMQSAGWLGRTKARPYVAIRCAGVSNSGSVPGGVSGGGIAALAAWVAQKKRHKPHFHSVTLAPRIIERY